MSFPLPSAMLEIVSSVRRSTRRAALPSSKLRAATLTGQPTKVGVVGLPTDLGASHRGVELGPAALRIAGLFELLEEAGHGTVDTGDISVPHRRTLREGDARLRYGKPIAALSQQLYRTVRSVAEAGTLPLVLGGDHSLSIGSVAAMADFVADQGGRLGVIWLDAHCDMNTPDTTPSGNVHGMSLASLLGRGPAEFLGVGQRSPSLAPEQVALVGCRSIDPGEARWISECGILSYPMQAIEEQGISAVMREALDRLLSTCTHLHLSFDIDCIDPAIARGVGTRVHGGMSVAETRRTLELIRDAQRCVSVDVVEVNPLRDHENETAELTVSLLSSLFGSLA